MNRINLTTFQLKDPIEERSCFFLSIEHHQRSTTQYSQPDLDIKTQRLTVELHDLVSMVHRLNIHLKRFSHATLQPQCVTEHSLKRDLNAWIVTLIGDRFSFSDFFDIFICRSAVR